MVFRAPMYVTISPQTKFPMIAPIDTIAPIHDLWSVESGPDVNGVSFDSSNGVAIDTQPVGGEINGKAISLRDYQILEVRSMEIKFLLAFFSIPVAHPKPTIIKLASFWKRNQRKHFAR